MLQLNADFSQRATVTPDDYQWVTSPQPGVERVMLDRIGNEQARATSLVRYAAHSDFPAHSHPGGEEILVLSGTFTEDGMDYPAGWYLRSPDGSSHQPSSQDGTLIFVKLRQMSVTDLQFIRINTQDPSHWHGHVCPLYTSETETVRLQRLIAGKALFDEPISGGAEVLVLEGGLIDAKGQYEKGSWLRFPPEALPTLMASAAGALCYLKTGHLHPETLIGVKGEVF